MFNKKILVKNLIFSLLIAITLFFIFHPAQAKVNPLNGLNIVGNSSGYETGGSAADEHAVILLVAEIIKYLLSFLGVLFMLLVIYAGFLWMTAGGNDEQITKAKSLIKNGIIGLVITLGAGVIVSFFFYVILKVTIF